MFHVDLYADGACRGNPGPGGWAAVLVCGDRTKELTGGKTDTTNNEMEMMAVEQGLLALEQACVVTIYTDSQCVIGWMSMGWNCTKPHLVRLRNNIAAIEKKMGHRVSYVKVKGHSGDPMNDLADALAVAAIP
jgi:ribonuclease HI